MIDLDDVIDAYVDSKITIDVKAPGTLDEATVRAVLSDAGVKFKGWERWTENLF